MILGRRGGWLLVVLAAWTAFVWVTFVRNVWPDHHWDAFFVVHLGVGAVSTGLGLAAGWIGVRALRAPRQP